VVGPIFYFFCQVNGAAVAMAAGEVAVACGGAVVPPDPSAIFRINHRKSA
jgi:hypothetical protein